ncbi:hypothetical protein VTL71DRAFT_10478 [Oculimacula yallundae]|uniref:RRM domain-containing protein n=1 Tax=Oculimacula yallundae TaxID=86028 RepID=A0ABR4CTC8_9HELO
MAKDVQSKKRKASVPEVEAEKVKVKNVVASSTEAAPAKKRKANEDVAPAKVKKTKTKAPKNIIEEATPAIAPKKASKATTSAGVNDTTEGSKETSVASKKAIAAKSKTANTKKASASKKMGNKTSKIEADEVPEVPEPEIEVDEEDSEPELDEETLDILKGFESDEDEKEIDDGFPEGAEVPTREKLSKKDEKKLRKKQESAASDKPGVVYVGRIPHGFYENEMKAYFKQFGTILRLRLSRNKHSGASKHFAWIEFESSEVADIVARTMDNYMMFGHLLKVKLIPAEQVNQKWFIGANKRFKRVPWNKMEGRKLEQPKSEATWNLKNDREAEKRAKKAAQLKEIGYEIAHPTLKTATGVAKPKAPEELIDGEGEGKAVEAAPLVEQTTKSKKGKKGQKDIPDTTRGATPEQIDFKARRLVDISPSREDAQKTMTNLINAKKGPITKAVEGIVSAVEEAKAKKGKKVKKAKVVETTEEEITEPGALGPENKRKTKKSKTSLVETTVTPVDAPEETVTKTKKNNKRKASA